MKRCLICDYVAALEQPATSFLLLHGARVVRGEDGLPCVNRTSDVAEATVEWAGALWLLGLPLTPEAAERIRSTVRACRGIASRRVAPVRMLTDEWHTADAQGTPCTVDLVLQALPEGIPLERFACCDEALLDELEALERELDEAGIAHNNLRPEQIVVRPDGTMTLIRNYRMRCGAAGEDRAAFAAIRHWLEALPRQPLKRSACAAAEEEWRMNHFPGHLEVFPAADGLVRVRDASGYGFVDPENRTVIAATLCRAEDFCEGRAVAATETGAGIIDKQGRWVVEPRCDHAEYVVRRNLILVCTAGRWQAFDYTGVPVEMPAMEPADLGCEA